MRAFCKWISRLTLHTKAVPAAVLHALHVQAASTREATATHAATANARADQPNRRRSFTLLEVVVALALAATLMVLLLQITVSVHRSHADLGERDLNHDVTAALVELMRQDLAHARQVATRENAVRITGHSGIDTENQLLEHRPTQVTYVLVSSSAETDEPGTSQGDGRLLVREQIRFAATDDHVRRVEILSWHMDQFDVAHPNPDELPEADLAGWQEWELPLPAWAMLTLAWRDGRRSETMVTFK